MESDTERVLAILDGLGVEYRRETDGRAKVCCPFHHEKTPSMTIYDDNHCFCFGCQKHCWHDELIAKLAGCSIVEAKKKLGIFDLNVDYSTKKSGKKSELPKIDFSDPIKDFSSQFEKLPEDVPKQMTDFLTKKGLLDYAFELGLWRWHPKGTFRCWENQEGICIPYFGPKGEISTFRLRKYDRRRETFSHPLAPKGVSLQPSYLINDKRKPVYFCEGETDSLSVHATGRNVICLPGVGAHKQLHSAIMQCLDWKIPKLIFCGDNDEAGQTFNQHAIKITMTLGMGVFLPQIRALDLPEEYNILPEGGFKRKDLNDFFCEGRLEKILENFERRDTRREEYETENDELDNAIPKEDNLIKNMQQIFGNIEKVANEEGIF